MSECRLCCSTNRVGCHASSPNGDLCTRVIGHNGDHIACGTLNHDLHRWPNEKEEEDEDQHASPGS